MWHEPAQEKVHRFFEAKADMELFVHIPHLISLHLNSTSSLLQCAEAFIMKCTV